MIEKCANTTHSIPTNKKPERDEGFALDFGRAGLRWIWSCDSIRALGTEQKNQIINIQNEPQHTNVSASEEEEVGRLSGDLSSI